MDRPFATGPLGVKMVEARNGQTSVWFQRPSTQSFSTCFSGLGAARSAEPGRSVRLSFEARVSLWVKASSFRARGLPGKGPLAAFREEPDCKTRKAATNARFNWTDMPLPYITNINQTKGDPPTAPVLVSTRKFSFRPVPLKSNIRA